MINSLHSFYLSLLLVLLEERLHAWVFILVFVGFEVGFFNENLHLNEREFKLFDLKFE